MITTLICFLITGVLKITATQLEEKYAWIEEYQTYLTVALVVFVVLFFVFVIVAIANKLRK